MSKTEGPSTELSDASVAGCAASVVAGLDRVFCVAGLYPSGHATITQATECLHKSLAAFLSGFPLLVIESRDGTLLVQSQPVDLDKPGACRLAGTLEALGIVRLEIDATVSPVDLFEFGTIQRNATQKARSARSFGVVDFESLPKSIRVVPREFGKRKTGGDSRCYTSDQIDAALRQVMSTLRDHDLGTETEAACRHLVERVFGKIQEKLEVTWWSGPNIRQSRDRPLEKALELGVSAVQGALQTFLSDEGDSGSLADLFDLAEKAIAFSEDEGTMRLVMEAIEEARDEAGPEALAGADEPADDLDCRWSAEELCARMATNGAEWDPEASLSTSDACELISVCTQLLLHDPTPRSLAGIRDSLTHSLAGWLGSRERHTVRAALGAILDSGNPTLIDRSLPLLLNPLRVSRQLSVGELLLELARERPSDLDSVLPHVINELLRGIDALEPETARGLLDLVAEVSEEAIHEWVHRLLRLRTIRDRLIPRRLLRPPPRELRPVLAAILRSGRDSIVGLLLLDGLRDFAGSFTGMEALRLAENGDPASRELLLRLLNEDPGEEPSGKLLSAAGRVIVERLPLLPIRRRREPVAARAVQALGELRTAGARSVLETVVGERRWGPFHAWPRSCRRAARRALRVLGTRGGDQEARS